MELPYDFKEYQDCSVDIGVFRDTLFLDEVGEGKPEEDFAYEHSLGLEMRWAQFHPSPQPEDTCSEVWLVFRSVLSEVFFWT